PHHPAVEIMAGSTGGAGMIGRIQIVRPAFEDRDSQTVRAQGPDESDRHGGFPDMTRCARNHETRNHMDFTSQSARPSDCFPSSVLTFVGMGFACFLDSGSAFRKRCVKLGS